MTYEGAKERWTDTVARMVMREEKTGSPFYKQNSEDLVTDYILVKGKEQLQVTLSVCIREWSE